MTITSLSYNIKSDFMINTMISVCSHILSSSGQLIRDYHFHFFQLTLICNTLSLLSYWRKFLNLNWVHYTNWHLTTWSWRTLSPSFLLSKLFSTVSPSSCKPFLWSQLSSTTCNKCQKNHIGELNSTWSLWYIHLSF